VGLRERLAGILGKSPPLTPSQRTAAAKAAARAARESLALIPPQQVARPVWTEWSTESAIRNGLKASEWVYSCVRKLASAMSSVPWFVEQRVSEDEWERDDTHPLGNLLAQPNPQMSRQDLFERTAHHLYLGGNAFWHIERNSKGIPLQLVPLPADQIKPLPSGRGLELAGYQYHLGSKKIRLDAAEICHLQFIDPANPFWGLAPLRAAMQTVDTDVEAVRWNKISLQNRAVTDGLFAFKYPLTDEQWETAREHVREQHTGAANAHMPWVLGADASYTQMSLSPVEMDFLKSRYFNVASICNVFGVPVVLVTQERTTFNNMATGRRMFWQDTIIPLLDDIADALDLKFTPYWNPEGLSDPTKKVIRVRYDVSGVPAMQEIWREALKSAREAWEMGVPFNELNQRMELGFHLVPGGDLAWGGKEPGAPGMGTGVVGKRAVPAIETKAGMPEQEKAAYYKAFDNDRARWEQRVAEGVAEIFGAEGEQVAAAYEDGGQGAITGAINLAATSWTGYWLTVYGAMVKHFGTLEGRRIIRALPKAAPNMGDLERKEWEGKERSWAFNFDDPEVDHFIRTTTAEHISIMSETTKDAIAEAVAAGVSQNEGAADIARRIREAYANWAGKGDSPLDRSRSFMIARTEAGAAVNFGHHEGARQVVKETDAVVLKEWISSGDSRVRDSHAAVNGEIVGMEEAFSNGLLYPNEAGAPAAEVIACRCTVGHIVEGLSA